MLRDCPQIFFRLSKRSEKMKQAILLSRLHLSRALCFVIESEFILSLSALTGSYPILLQLMESTASFPSLLSLAWLQPQRLPGWAAPEPRRARGRLVAAAPRVPAGREPRGACPSAQRGEVALKEQGNPGVKVPAQ